MFQAYLVPTMTDVPFIIGLPLYKFLYYGVDHIKTKIERWIEPSAQIAQYERCSFLWTCGIFYLTLYGFIKNNFW